MPNLSQHNPNGAYINVMEILVTEEVEQQLQAIPAKVRRYLKVEEVVTYALNRLPALYASSERGLKYQKQTARQEMHAQISAAVRQAIAAVQVDPIRLSQPLQVSQNQEADEVLQALCVLFKQPDLNWGAALQKINEFKLHQTALPKTSERRSVDQPWRPLHQSHKVGWTHRHRRPQQPQKVNSRKPTESEMTSGEVAGWDNSLYRL